MFFSSFHPLKMCVRKEKNHKLTPGLIPIINQPSNHYKRARRLWLLLSQTAWLVAIDPRPCLKCQYHLFWVVSLKKNHLHWSGRSVSRWLSLTTIGNTGWNAPRNVRQAVHGPVGHLSAADNLQWPVAAINSSAAHTISAAVFSKKKSIKSVFGDERSSGRWTWGCWCWFCSSENPCCSQTNYKWAEFVSMLIFGLKVGEEI